MKRVIFVLFAFLIGCGGTDAVISSGDTTENEKNCSSQIIYTCGAAAAKPVYFYGINVFVRLFVDGEGYIAGLISPVRYEDFYAMGCIINGKWYRSYIPAGEDGSSPVVFEYSPGPVVDNCQLGMTFKLYLKYNSEEEYPKALQGNCFVETFLNDKIEKVWFNVAESKLSAGPAAETHSGKVYETLAGAEFCLSCFDDGTCDSIYN